MLKPPYTRDAQQLRSYLHSMKWLNNIRVIYLELDNIIEADINQEIELSSNRNIHENVLDDNEVP